MPGFPTFTVFVHHCCVVSRALLMHVYYYTYLMLPCLFQSRKSRDSDSSSV